MGLKKLSKCGTISCSKALYWQSEIDPRIYCSNGIIIIICIDDCIISAKSATRLEEAVSKLASRFETVKWMSTRVWSYNIKMTED